MANAREQMKMLRDELERVRQDMVKLKTEESMLIKLLGRMGDGAVKKAHSNRALGVKSAVLNLAFEAKETGVAAQEASEAIAKTIPNVAKDTVRSVLSRLKSDGALSYVGDRYYIAEFAPKSENKVTSLRPTIQKQYAGE